MGYVRVIIAAAACAFALGAFPAPAAAQLPCGLLRPCPPPPPPAPPSPTPAGHRMELAIDPPRVSMARDEDDRVILSGRYTVNGGPPSRMPTVEIWMRQWPYTQETLLSRNGEPGGHFDVGVGWQANAKFYARVDIDPSPAVTTWVTSPVVTLTTYPEFLDFEVDVVKAWVVEMEFSYEFPAGPSIRLGKRTIHWYMITRKGKRLKIRRVARSRTRVKREDYGRIVSGEVRARIPRVRRKVRLGFCIDVPVGVDVGVGEPATHRCP